MQFSLSKTKVLLGWENDSQYVLVVANHFLTWLANSANHISGIILHLVLYTYIISKEYTCLMQNVETYVKLIIILRDWQLVKFRLKTLLQPPFHLTKVHGKGEMRGGGRYVL